MYRLRLGLYIQICQFNLCFLHVSHAHAAAHHTRGIFVGLIASSYIVMQLSSSYDYSSVDLPLDWFLVVLSEIVVCFTKMLASHEAGVCGEGGGVWCLEDEVL